MSAPCCIERKWNYSCLAIIAAISSLLVMRTAAAAEISADVVDGMKAQYYDKFSMLPPSRKCTPEDAMGAWVEKSIFEEGARAISATQEAEGLKYLFFGSYNTLVWQRSKASLDIGSLTGLLQQSKKQYIMTTAGMLYAYDNGSIESSALCFVSTQATQQYAKGLLMLAVPLEKESSFAITIYAPIGN